MKHIKVILPIVALLFTLSCKKFVEDQKRKAAMSFITSGQWQIESFLVDTMVVTSEFAGYKFQFNDDETVNAINSTITTSGTWLGDVTDYSITSEFPGAGEPLAKVNGHWVIKDSGTSYVKADRDSGSGIMHLHLVKVP